jgi:hypothetical protein
VERDTGNVPGILEGRIIVQIPGLGSARRKGKPYPLPVGNLGRK